MSSTNEDAADGDDPVGNFVPLLLFVVLVVLVIVFGVATRDSNVRIELRLWRKLGWYDAISGMIFTLKSLTLKQGSNWLPNRAGEP